MYDRATSATDGDSCSRAPTAAAVALSLNRERLAGYVGIVVVVGRGLHRAADPPRSPVSRRHRTSSSSNKTTQFNLSCYSSISITFPPTPTAVKLVVAAVIAFVVPLSSSPFAPPPLPPPPPGSSSTPVIDSTSLRNAYRNVPQTSLLPIVATTSSNNEDNDGHLSRMDPLSRASSRPRAPSTRRRRRSRAAIAIGPPRRSEPSLDRIAAIVVVVASSLSRC